MTEEQLTLANIMRQTVYAYSLTLNDVQEQAELYVNFNKFCDTNGWDLSRFEADSLTSIMEGTCWLAGFQKELKEPAKS